MMLTNDLLRRPYPTLLQQPGYFLREFLYINTMARQNLWIDTTFRHIWNAPLENDGMRRRHCSTRSCFRKCRQCVVTVRLILHYSCRWNSL